MSQNGATYGSGEIPGLSQTMLESFKDYRPSELGPCYIDPRITVSLPYPEWYKYSWLEQGVASLTAAQSAAEVIYTVPLNERCYLHGLYATRATGDNTVAGFALIYPSDYTSGGGNLTLLTVTTFIPVAWWPDPGDIQGLDTNMPGDPLLLEPGTIIELDPGAAGASASTFNFNIMLTRFKLVRSLAPA